ncbi:hypothetical protein RUM43_012364 [Polyplax serrata]|uniref:Uncharacterized protein n=1 Tax=Polyplax serrata TaxID=468196 RepID=A0AAN8PDI9_POLSC
MRIVFDEAERRQREIRSTAGNKATLERQISCQNLNLQETRGRQTEVKGLAPKEEENPLSTLVVDDNRVASNTMDRTTEEKAKRQKTSVMMAEGELLAPPS